MECVQLLRFSISHQILTNYCILVTQILGKHHLFINILIRTRHIPCLCRHFKPYEKEIVLQIPNIEVCGDVVIMVYHLRHSWFALNPIVEVIRLVFHTAFVGSKATHITFRKEDLDIAIKDPKYEHLCFHSL